MFSLNLSLFLVLVFSFFLGSIFVFLYFILPFLSPFYPIPVFPSPRLPPVSSYPLFILSVSYVCLRDFLLLVLMCVFFDFLSLCFRLSLMLFVFSPSFSYLFFIYVCFDFFLDLFVLIKCLS